MNGIEKSNDPSCSVSSKSCATDSSNKAEKVAELIKEMLEIINPNANEEIKEKTPMRYAKALLELTRGYNEDPVDVISEAIFDSEGFDEMVVVKDINFNSMCEHHMLPFFGNCVVGYIPNKKILGLSKFPRLVQSLASKFNIQERLTKEIADRLNEALEPRGVVVLMKSTHSCMCFRGVKSFKATTDTIYSIGAFKEQQILNKFFNLTNN